MQDYYGQNKQFVAFAERVLHDCGKIVVDWRGKESSDGRYLNEIVAGLVNETIEVALARDLPTHRLFTKGSVDGGDEGYEWICDPLDGAFLYSKGLTAVVISMTLIYQGDPIVTVIYQPFLDEMYVAVKGCGVRKNRQLLSRPMQKLDKFSVINVEWWPAAAYNVDAVVHNLSMQYELYPLHIGSVVYSACLVAEGAIAASLFGGRLVGKNHEAAAVMLLMQESDGRYTDLLGESVGFTGTINGFIISSQEAFLDILAGLERISHEINK